MGPDTPPGQNLWQSPYGGTPQPGPPAAYGPPHGWQPTPQTGPPGTVRPTGKAILLAVVTIGIYVYVYNYRIHQEMKEHSGRGVGGGVALLLTFAAGIAMPFVTSADVGALYARRGEREPVRGWTGLWVLLPSIGGYLAMFIALVAVAATTAPGSTGTGSEAIAIAVGFAAFLVVALGGAIVWFVKTNGALNRYWESAGQAATATPSYR